MNNSKYFIGPMSKNVVDAVIEANQNLKKSIGFIPSRRQVEYNGGYVNNWTTKSFSNYVKSYDPSILITRDHGGPGQGYSMDDGTDSYKEDANYFDIIHIDPWKKFPDYDAGLEQTIFGIKLCNATNPNCLFEVGTEEAIRVFSESDLSKLLGDLEKNLSKELFLKIKYGVVQSGVGLDLGNQINTGTFDPNRLRKMVEICDSYNILSKEHNGDYLSFDEMETRFEIGLNSINIAPEFGQLETDFFIEILKKTDDKLFEDFYNICFQSKRWEKWVDKSFNPEAEKEKVIKISGHYVFSEPNFIILKKKIADCQNIDVSKLDLMVKEKIKNYLLNFN